MSPMDSERHCLCSTTHFAAGYDQIACPESYDFSKTVCNTWLKNAYVACNYIHICTFLSIFTVYTCVEEGVCIYIDK